MGQRVEYTSSYAYKSGGSWRKGVRYKEGGRWRSKTAQAAAKRKADARREAERWREELNAREAEIATSPGRVRAREGTVAAYMRAYVDGLEADGTVSPSTVKTYRDWSRDVENPDGGIANVPLGELDAAMVRDWGRWLRGPERGLSARSAGFRRTLLNSALKQAVDDRTLTWNPLSTVRAPKVEREPPNSLDSRSVAVLGGWIASHPGESSATMAALGLYGGMRRGECLALKWSDVDFDRGFLVVSRSIAIRDGGAYEKGTKTGRSRMVPLSDELADALEARAGAMAGEIEDLLGIGADEAEPTLRGLYVTGRVDGSFRSPAAFTHLWRATSDALGLTCVNPGKPTFHTLRHTFATSLINEGVDVKTTSAILGHASAAMTLNVYASANPEAIMGAAGRISKALGGGARENPDEPEYELPSGA